jgi:hypothetical protein
MVPGWGEYKARMTSPDNFIVLPPGPMMLRIDGEGDWNFDAAGLDGLRAKLSVVTCYDNPSVTIGLGADGGHVRFDILTETGKPPFALTLYALHGIEEIDDDRFDVTLDLGETLDLAIEWTGDSVYVTANGEMCSVWLRMPVTTVSINVRDAEVRLDPVMLLAYRP